MRLLRVLLDDFAANQGVGASGLDFFAVPGVARAEDRRDILLLRSLKDALDLLAGPSFAGAFQGSTEQGDYRWGKLHRVVFQHVLGEPFSIPPAGGAFPPPLAGLAGIPIDGGWTVDAGFFSSRADHAEAFVFGGGPARRSVHEARPDGIRADSILPGGTSGDVGSRYHFNLLPHWLTNDSLPLLVTKEAIAEDGGDVLVFVPGT
jgi:penicillin amidase